MEFPEINWLLCWKLSKTLLLFYLARWKNIFAKLQTHCKPIPVMKTGLSLWNFSHREKPVFIIGNLVLIAGIPVMKTGFSVWEKLHKENPVFITGMGLQCVWNFAKMFFHLAEWNKSNVLLSFQHKGRLISGNSIPKKHPIPNCCNSVGCFVKWTLS